MGAGTGEEGARGGEDFIDGYDGMPGWTLLAIGLINSCKENSQKQCLGRQRIWHALIVTRHGMIGRNEITEFAD